MVSEERILQKRIRNRVAFAPDYADLYARYSIIKKTDTHITIKQTHVTENAPYVENFEVWLVWDMLTADPQSKQTTFRKQFKVKWFDKPMIWRMIQGIVGDRIIEHNDKLPTFFQEGTVNFLKGPPYADLSIAQHPWSNTVPTP